MEIIIDTREPVEIIDAISAKLIEVNGKYRLNIVSKLEAMDTGDITYRIYDSDIAIIERKTWDDLSASMKDGRYESQCARMDELISKCYKVYWLIEGQMPQLTGNDHGMLNQCLHGKIISMHARGYHIIYSSGINQSAHIICNLMRGFINMYSDNDDYVVNKNKLPSNNTLERFMDSITLPNNIDEEFRIELCDLFRRYKLQINDAPKTMNIRGGSKEYTPLRSVTDMWRVILGKAKIIPKLMEDYSIRTILNNPSMIRDFKYPSGKRLNNRDKFVDRASSDEVMKDIIECVKGVSASLADFIYNSVGPTALRTITEPIQLIKDGRAISKNIFPRYIECLDYKHKDIL